MTEQEYRADSEHLNYSLLKQLDKHPSNVISNEEVWNEGMEFGDIVDILATNPDSFDEKYAIINFEKPSGQVLQLADYVYNLAIRNNEGFDKILYESHVLQGIDDLGIFKTPKDDNKRKTKLEENNFWDYLAFLFESEGKRVIDSDRYMECEIAVSSLQSHPFTAGYFHSIPSDVQVFDQVPFFAELSGVKFKVLVDRLLVNLNKNIIEPVDLKTGWSEVENFPYTFFNQRYDIQCSLYTDVITYGKPENEALRAILEQNKNINIEPYKFIVINSKPPYNCAIWSPDKRVLNHGRIGGRLYPSGKHRKGYVRLATELKWHQDNDLWDYPKEIYDNNGHMTIEHPMENNVS